MYTPDLSHCDGSEERAGHGMLPRSAINLSGNDVPSWAIDTRKVCAVAPSF